MFAWSYYDYPRMTSSIMYNLHAMKVLDEKEKKLKRKIVKRLVMQQKPKNSALVVTMCEKEIVKLTKQLDEVYDQLHIRDY